MEGAIPADPQTGDRPMTTITLPESAHPDLPRVWWTDGGAGSPAVMYEADSAEEAAQAYVDDGSWGDPPYGDVTQTTWVDVWVWQPGREDDRECHTITIEPDEPECSEAAHEWRDVGTWGHGGGVIIEERCRHCGLKRITDTWAQRRDTGEQGLRSVAYESPDDGDDCDDYDDYDADVEQ